MASIRALICLSSFNRRVLAMKTWRFTTIVRHKSAISCFTRHSRCITLLKSQSFPNRYVHDDKGKVDSQEYNDKLRGGEEGADSKNQEQEKQLTQVQRLRKIFAEYGSTAIAFHVTISLTSLGICYTAVQSGLDVPLMLQKIGISKGITDSAVTTGASTFVIAYACHKVFAPLRMFLTITCTPLIVRRLRTMGILKAPIKQSQ
ncbi:Protein FAM210B [Exaiptasia diaphana]|nr:Protein FAM210B [Exaiptasia diaphana]